MTRSPISPLRLRTHKARPTARHHVGLWTGAARRAAHAARGFTLVEIMIAIGIFGGVMVAIYASWASILRGSRLGMEAAAGAQRMRMSMRVIQDALVSAQMYQDNLALYAIYADTSTDFASFSVAAHLAKEFPGSGIFEGQPVRRVSFSVEPGPNRSSQLVMRQSPLLAPIDAREEPYAVVLGEDVSLFALEFWGQNSKEWETEWTLTNQLPRLVRVTLGFGQSGRSAFSARPKEVVSRTVAIPALIIPRAFQTAAGGGAPGAPVPVPPGGQPGLPGQPGVPVPLPPGGGVRQ